MHRVPRYRQNVSNSAGLVWKANFWHLFGGILGLGAYFSKPIFALKPWVQANQFEYHEPHNLNNFFSPLKVPTYTWLPRIPQSTPSKLSYGLQLSLEDHKKKIYTERGDNVYAFLIGGTIGVGKNIYVYQEGETTGVMTLHNIDRQNIATSWPHLASWNLLNSLVLVYKKISK